MRAMVTASRGVMTKLTDGARFMVAPKPVKPRMRPAEMAIATAKAKAVGLSARAASKSMGPLSLF